MKRFRKQSGPGHSPRKRPRRGQAVRLETLEPRILLSGELLLPQEPPPLLTDPNAQSFETTSSSGTVNTANSGTGLLPDPHGAPLEILSASGQTRAASDSLSDHALSLRAGDTLIGQGKLDGDLVNQGTVAPGASPGVVAAQTFTQTGSGVLRLEIGGTTPGAGSVNPLDGYDQLDIAGLATLDGTLSVSCINDFRPSAGQVFDVLKMGSRTGSFANYTGLYVGQGVYLKPVYQADRLQLVATALPGLADLTLPDLPEARDAFDRVLTSVANRVSCAAVRFDAGLQLAGLRLAGTWEVGVVPLANGTAETTFSAVNVSSVWTAGGISGALEGVVGRLVLSGGQSSL
ncbi:MAG: LEPR-XLL domain-containing protein, partial [Magnetococcales bacterium]|nr:LEPR-XLL domain-containing protein [Magnetococcales bacterium]